MRARERARRKKDPQSARDRAQRDYYRAEYGISLEDRDAMLERQGGKCATCARAIHFSRTTKENKAHVDHCHVTGKIRGVLCNRCNAALGLLGDSADTLRAAIDYLERNRG